MAFQSVAEQMLKEVLLRARSFERGVQRVVEVISPGPLGTKADSWDAQRRHRAAQAVRAAVERWEVQNRLSASRSKRM